MPPLSAAPALTLSTGTHRLRPWTFVASSQLYNTMVALDTNAQVQNVLVEEFTPNADATAWTMRLRSDITFHNGKPLRAEDLMFTLQRIADPKAPLPGASTIAPCDVPHMKKLDDLTVYLPCKTPYATFIESLAGDFLFFNIVPVGYDPKKPGRHGPLQIQGIRARCLEHVREK